jgi:hypothetical protein
MKTPKGAESSAFFIVPSRSKMTLDIPQLDAESTPRVPRICADRIDFEAVRARVERRGALDEKLRGPFKSGAAENR